MSVHDELMALCRRMRAAGEIITYEELKARRGGIGSRRDIAKALKAFREEAMEGVIAAPPGRPSRIEIELRGVVERQQQMIGDLEQEVRDLQEEIKVLVGLCRHAVKPMEISWSSMIGRSMPDCWSGGGDRNKGNAIR